MSTYRPLIDKDKLEQLEHYRFRLAEYLESPDFKHEISTSVQKAILIEISYIETAINVIKNIIDFNANDKPIVGWPLDNPNEKDGYLKVYNFTSAALAAKILGLNKAKITSVCNGNITCTGGKHVYCKEQKRRVRKEAWYFKYLSDYNEDESTVGGTANPDLPFYDIIKI